MTETPPKTGRRRGLGFMFWVAAGFLTVLVLSAVFADVLPLKDPAETFRGTAKAGPSAAHWFGSDGVGRDIFSRVVYGAQVSLVISAVGTLAAVSIGGTIGLVAGYLRGRVDRLVSAVVNATLVVPPLILFLALILFLDPTAKRRVFILIFTFVLLSVAPIARVVRASTLVWSEREFVLAARTVGARDGRILVREVLPNVAPPLISYALIIMAGLIVVEGAVAFLGLSVPPPTPTWGDMINKGRTNLDIAAHISLVPAMAMFTTVLALNFVGDKLQERFDPRSALL
ncbi:MAG TPA: ABC transporter permease [Acidimicrobiaceae bacterium]|nr:ABC transporter permease [Acidimicrobiaceae bacterium]HCB37710.1 ABC transporter permease [Acidimicrobiaceae bacterium]